MLRSLEAIALPRSLVKFSDDIVAVGLADLSQALSFREVLAQQTVAVFVAASLLWVMRIGEVAADPCDLLQGAIAVELGAVVLLIVVKGIPLVWMAHSAARLTARTVQFGSFITNANPELRSTNVIRQSRSPEAPITVSPPPQWPASRRSSTASGRVSIIGLLASFPRFSGP